MSRERRRDNNRKSINEKRNILKNADISIKNNTTSRIILKSQIGGGSIYILANNGDIEDVPFNELHDIFKRHRKLFEEFKIIIEDVYCPDNDEMTIEDVKMVLGLKERVNSLPKSVINRLLDRAIILYKQGEFSNFNKMSLLEKKLGIEYVFEDIDRSMRPVRSDIDLL